MATNAGAIKYTVEANTAQMLKAEAVVDKTLENMSRSFDKADGAVRDYEKTQKDLGRTINRMGQVVDKNGKIISTATNKYRTLASTASQSFNQLNNQISKSAKGVNKGIASMGRSSGQAGIQFQQFIGQIQGGQSPMLGFVLGAPLLGAVVGITSSLVGMLIPALLDSGDVIEELTEKIKEWKKTIGFKQEQANLLINKEVEANTVRAKSIADRSEEIRIIQIAIKNQEQALLVDRKNEKTKKNLAEANRKSKIELNDLIALQQSETQVVVDSGKKIDVLNASVGKGTEKTKEQKEAISSLTSTLDSQLTSLEQQAMALIKGEEAAFRWATAQRLGMKGGEQFEESIDKRITSIFKLKAAQDKIAEDEKNRKQEEADTKSLTGQVQSIGLTQEESITEKFKKDLELLRQAEEQKIEVIGTYEERRVELRRQAEERIAGINKKGTQDSILNFEALENQAIGTFAGIASGAMDGKEAIRSLAQSVLTQMIGSLIKMGIQAVIGQTTTAAATSASMAVIASAAAPAAALVSLATSGANAPLAAAGITSTVGLAQAASIAGGRQFGGPVTQGNNYRVNEGGKPEVLSSGGKDYLMNSPNGKVKQMDEIGGGGGTTININNMAAGVDVQASTSNDGRTIEIAVRKAVAEMTNQVASGNGAFIRALKSGTNVKTRAGS
jgi:hypothetical protein